MHAVRLLQNLTEKSCSEAHKKRSDCVFEVVTALISCGKLWISELGRAIKNKTTAKHNIKKVDYLIGNGLLHKERRMYYEFVTRTFLGNKKRPIIIIDWSPVNGSCEHHFLRAAVAVKGRSMTLYEEVHELRYYANSKVHSNFLKRLASIIPADCRPIVITDAGFRNTWFGLITELNWDYVGRLRYNTFVKKHSDDEWYSAKILHAQARSTPKYLGQYEVARANPMEMKIYLFRGKEKGRIKKTVHGNKCESSNSKKYAKSAKEPWVIVTSLPHQNHSAKKVINLYRLRMQIEGSFKDIKNKRHGFRLPESGTKQLARLENLILIALLATVAVWLAGQLAINNKWCKQIQANTIRDYAVLSIAFLGTYVLRNLHYYTIRKKDLLSAFQSLQNNVVDWSSDELVKI